MSVSHQALGVAGNHHLSEGFPSQRKRDLTLPVGSVVKTLIAMQEMKGDAGLIPGSGRSPGEGNGNAL